MNHGPDRERIANYRLLEELGRGGMGVVYRAQAPDGAEVALKVLLPDRFHASGQRRFRVEVEALSRLRHPNVVQILDAGEHDGHPWLAMRYVSGGTLGDRLRRGPLSIGACIGLVRQVAEALNYLHTCGVVHRDLKPDNVLLDGERVVVTDFGLARDAETSVTAGTVTGQFLGSPGFWAPEQATGQVARMGPHSDVYGMGALLYASLTGAPPVEAKSLTEFLRLAEQPFTPPALKEVRSDVPRWLAQLCQDCMAYAPKDRPTAADVVSKVREFTRGGDLGGTAKARWIALTCALLAVASLLSAWGYLRLDARSTGASETEPGLVSPPESSPPTDVAARPQPPTDSAQPEEPSPRAQAAALEARALAHLQAGRPADALPGLEEALRLDPTRASCFANLGNAKRALGRNAEAISDYDHALRLDPRLPLVHYNRGAARLELGNADGAVADATQALALAPQSAHAYVLRGNAQRALEHRDEARADYARALEIDPDSTGARFNLGLVLTELGHLQEGLAALEALLEREPDNAPAHYTAGQAQRGLGRPLEAIVHFDSCLKLNPENATAYYARAVAKSQLQRWDDVLADCDHALQLQPDLADAWVARGSAHAALGESTQALADYRRGLDVDPRNALAYQNRGNLHARGGRYPQAIVDYTRALELQPDSALPYLLRGRAQLAQGASASALDDCERASRLQLGPQLQAMLRDLEAEANAALTEQRR